MNKWIFALVFLVIAFSANCDVPERPDFCGHTACVSITQSRAKIEASTTHFDNAKNEEQIWIWLTGGVTIGLHVFGPEDQSKCTYAAERIPITYPPNQPGRGCRFVTVNVLTPSNELTRDFVKSLEMSVWGVEDFPNGMWEKGVSQRIGPVVPLCIASLQRSRASMQSCKKTEMSP